MKRQGIAACLLLMMAVVALSAQTLAPATVPELSAQNDQLKNTIQVLVQQVNEGRETNGAQAKALVEKTAQIQECGRQLQGQAPALIAQFEKANPGKTLDPQTLTVKDKPKVEAAPKL